MYRVFLGAPTKADIQNDPNSYSWRTLSSKTASISSKSTHLIQPTQSVVFPLATLEAASYRISLIYKDVVFDDDDLDEESLDYSSLLNEGEQDNDNEQDRDIDGVVDVSVFRGVEQTTLLTWPPSAQNDSNSVSADKQDDSGSRESLAGPSFLLDLSSKSASAVHPHSESERSTQAVESQLLLHTETQDLESQSSGHDSYSYSDASSIARFPSFHFNLHTLTSLASLASTHLNPNVKGQFQAQRSQKINLLLAVLEVEGPDTIRVKKGKEAGKEVSILKMILGDEEGTVCKLTAWREVAEEWGGAGKSVAAKRGDIIHIENVMATCDPATSISLSASTYLKSGLTICYRTMPYMHEDGRLRPDLRLGASDPSVRRVAAIVRWFEQMAGLAAA